MSYDIQPREMARVAAETAAERDRLRDALGRVGPLVEQAMDGTRPSPTVSAELDRFLAEHEKSTREMVTRIDSALENGERAVRAYVDGDADMAAAYARESVVVNRPRVPYSPPPPGAAQFLPETIRG